MKKDFRGKKTFKGGGGFVKHRRDDGARPEMHDATCGQCGQDCQVPFKPMGRRPVLCNACFHKDEGFAPRSFRPEQRSPMFDRAERSDRPERFERNDRPVAAPTGIETRLRVIEEKLDAIFQALTDDNV